MYYFWLGREAEEIHEYERGVAICVAAAAYLDKWETYPDLS